MHNLNAADNHGDVSSIDIKPRHESCREGARPTVDFTGAMHSHVCNVDQNFDISNRESIRAGSFQEVAGVFTAREQLQPGDALLEAVRSDAPIQIKRDRIRTILDDSPSAIHAAESDTARTALHLAVLANDEQLVQVLTSNTDVDMSARDVFGMTALSIAVACGHDRLVSKLLYAASACDSNQGSTSLHDCLFSDVSLGSLMTHPLPCALSHSSTAPLKSLLHTLKLLDRLALASGLPSGAQNRRIRSLPAGTMYHQEDTKGPGWSKLASDLKPGQAVSCLLSQPADMTRRPALLSALHSQKLSHASVLVTYGAKVDVVDRIYPVSTSSPPLCSPLSSPVSRSSDQGLSNPLHSSPYPSKSTALHIVIHLIAALERLHYKQQQQLEATATEPGTPNASATDRVLGSVSSPAGSVHRSLHDSAHSGRYSGSSLHNASLLSKMASASLSSSLNGSEFLGRSQHSASSAAPPQSRSISSPGFRTPHASRVHNPLRIPAMPRQHPQEPGVPAYQGRLGDAYNLLKLMTQQPSFQAAMMMQDADGNTPLHVAAIAGLADACNLLVYYCIQQRAVRSMLNKRQMTPIECASAAGYCPVISVLSSHLCDASHSRTTGYAVAGRVDSSGRGATFSTSYGGRSSSSSSVSLYGKAASMHSGLSARDEVQPCRPCDAVVVLSQPQCRSLSATENAFDSVQTKQNETIVPTQEIQACAQVLLNASVAHVTPTPVQPNSAPSCIQNYDTISARSAPSTAFEAEASMTLPEEDACAASTSAQTVHDDGGRAQSSSLKTGKSLFKVFKRVFSS